MDTAIAPADWPELTDPQRAILIALPKHRTLAATADAIGINRVTVWRWAQNDAVFGNALQLVKEQVGDEIEGEMLRRAMAGQSPMSDTLLIFATKRHRPEYRDSSTLNIKQDIRVTHSIADLSTEDRVALLQLALQEESPLLGSGGDADVVDGEVVG